MAGHEAAGGLASANGIEPFYVLGFDVGGTKTVVALASHTGNLLAEIAAPTPMYDGQPDYPSVFVSLRDQVVRAAGIAPGRVRSAGLSVAGVVERGSGRVLAAPNLSRTDYDPRAIVQEALGLPTSIENDVNLAAVGEHSAGAARGLDCFVFVATGTGIGAGVFVGGRLHTGAHNAAGEVGYLYVHGRERVEPDGLGALERRAAGPGIAALAREYVASGRTSILSTRDPGALRSEDVWAAASAGDALASEVVAQTLDTLALALANIAYVLDPEMIVLGGGVSEVGDALLLPLRARLAALLVPPVAPRLEKSALGRRAQLYGAVSQALDLCR